MYIPPEFLVTDRSVLLDFIRKNSFGLFITCNGEMEASHIPMIIVKEDPLTIWGHLATGNQQLSGLNGSRAFIVFGGPHAYISPRWYAEEGQVPTWNYATVHIHGTVKLSSRKETTEMLEKMVKYYESDSQLSGKLDSDRYQDMMSGIVGFSLVADKVEGKFKMSQNHSVADREGVVNNLQKSRDPYEREVARMVSETIPQKAHKKDF